LLQNIRLPKNIEGLRKLIAVLEPLQGS
jgi:hypothetical protein